MSGNVWEWCGTHGVIRGGSWSLVDYGCRVSSRRDASDPDDRYYNRGFRLLQKQILAEENSR
jgi:formylglycine-generating enzyme required for sulfatase activity